MDRRLEIELDGDPDGCCLDQDGGIWIGLGKSQRFVRVHAGRTLQSVATPGRKAVACQLGGTDGRTLYCLTAAGEVADIGKANLARIETLTVVRRRGRLSLIMRRLYRWYVLAVLILIYMVNQVDRQIVTILAPLSEARPLLDRRATGTVVRTAFALFYGVLGIPLAKLADAWHRVRTLWLGLLFWSA